MKHRATVKSDGIRNAIKEAIDRGKSPERIASLSGMATSSIYAILDSPGRVRIENVARIADAIGYEFERIGDDVKLWKKQEREPSQALSPSALEIIQLMEQLTDKQREQFIALVRGIWRTVKDGALGTY